MLRKELLIDIVDILSGVIINGIYWGILFFFLYYIPFAYLLLKEFLLFTYV